MENYAILNECHKYQYYLKKINTIGIGEVF